MADKANPASDKYAEAQKRPRRTGLRVIILLVLVGMAAALNFVDFGMLFRVPKNTAQVEIPATEKQAERPAPQSQPPQRAAESGQQPPQATPEKSGGAFSNATSGPAETNANATSAQNDLAHSGARNATQGPPAGADLAAQADINGIPGNKVDLGGGRSAEVGAIIPPVKADEVVTPRFITDLAAFLVNSYYPKGTHPAAVNSGISTLGLKSLNLRYGGALLGLNKPVDDPAERRKFVLRYVLMPSMVRALYSLYADTFINAMQFEAKNLERAPTGGVPRQLSPREQAEMFSIYAANARTLAAILQACTADREISKHMNAYWKAEKATADADLAFQNAQEKRNSAQGKDPANFSGAKAEADSAGAAYRDAIIKRENARSALISVMRGHPGVRGLGDEQMFYAVAWVERRLHDNPNVINAIDATSGLLDSLAGRMESLAAQR